MFQPQYAITDRLLANIKRISCLVNELNNKRFPNVVLLELERSAREVSSFASTSIEGNPLPLTEVKRILKSEPVHIRDSEKEILNYNQSLQDLNQQLKEGEVKLSIHLILNIQKQVIDGLLPKFETGFLREKPVIVNDPRIGQPVYLPPVVTKALLAAMGLNTFNLFSFENYYNNNVTKYFQTVGEFGNYYELVEKIDFTNWLEYFTEGIIDELLRVQKLLPEIALSPGSELQLYHLTILEFIQKKGFISDSDYVNLTGRAKATRALDFQKLTELGLIERRGKGRATYYVLKEK